MNNAEWSEIDQRYQDYVPLTSIQIAGQQAKIGDTVRLYPGRGRRGVLTDAFDMLLVGKTARIETFHQDFEDRIHVVVTLDDDPGREQWDERVLPGHRFFFFPEELDLLETINGRET